MSIHPNSTKKILVLDDEPHIITYLETLLADNGYQTCSACDGKEGLKKIYTEKPDLICLDITMPKESGIRFYRDIKARPDLPPIFVVIVTAVPHIGHDPESFARAVGTEQPVPPPEAFFTKPIDRDEFLLAIAKILS